MLLTARHGCAVATLATATAVRPSWSLVRHAESSTQAALRASRRSVSTATPAIPSSSAARYAHTQVRYAGAASVAKRETADIEGFDEEDEARWHIPPGLQRSLHSRISKPPDPDIPTISDGNTGPPDPPPRRRSRPNNEAPPEAPLATFRRLTSSDPLSSLLALPQIPPSELPTVTLLEIDVLIQSCYLKLRKTSLATITVDPDDVHVALVQLRAAIYEHPDGLFPGEKMRKKRLYRFLRLCLMLDQRDLVRSVWKERIEEQKRRKDKLDQPGQLAQLIQPDRLAQILADDQRDWKMILWMFNPGLFPVEYYTPQVLDRYMQAHLASSRPEAIPKLFDMHKQLNLKPSNESHNHLVQAYLQMGDVAGARVAAIQAQRDGVPEVEQQLAILRGHRVLGGTMELERKVLRDLQNLGLRPQAAIVNALIRLRLDDSDMEGAEKLLEFFDLVKGDTNPLDPATTEVAKTIKRIRPTADTYNLAMRIAARNRDLNRVVQLWSRLYKTPELVQDSHLSSLLNALHFSGGVKEIRGAVNLVESLIAETPMSVPVLIPAGLKPGIRSLNTLLQRLQDRPFDLTSLGRILRFFPRAGVEPTHHTVEIILDYLSKGNVSPKRLAIFLSAMLKEYPVLRPTISHLNTILAAAVRSDTQEESDPPQQLLSTESTRSTDTASVSAANAGLVIVYEPLREALRSILNSLHASSVKSNSTSMATRLRFDAFTQASAGGFPSAQNVWTSMLNRGFRPDKRHILALMKGYADSGAMTEAQAIITLAQDLQIQITAGMWMVLLHGWAKVQNLDNVRMAYKALRQFPEGTDLVAITAMAQACLSAGAFDQAAAVIQNEMLPRFSRKLDRKALGVAAQVLRSNNQEIEAIKLIDRNKRLIRQPLRHSVRNMRKWMLKKVEDVQVRNTPQGKDWLAGIRMCDRILDKTKYLPSEVDFMADDVAKRVGKGILQSLSGRRMDEGARAERAGAGAPIGPAPSGWRRRDDNFGMMPRLRLGKPRKMTEDPEDQPDHNIQLIAAHN